MELIALSGPRGVGKTTTSQIIYNLLYNVKDVYCFSFATYLREVIEKWYGKDIAVLSGMRDKKDVPLEYLNIKYTNTHYSLDTKITPRQLLINTGTYLRSINEDIFCIALEEKINEIALTRNNSLVIIDDLRFDNELRWVKSFPIPNWAITLDRIDTVLGTEDIEDYITFDKSDLCFQINTYKDPNNTGMCIEDVKFMIQDLLKIDLNGGI